MRISIKINKSRAIYGKYCTSIR